MCSFLIHDPTSSELNNNLGFGIAINLGLGSLHEQFFLLVTVFDSQAPQDPFRLGPREVAMRTGRSWPNRLNGLLLETIVGAALANHTPHPGILMVPWKPRLQRGMCVCVSASVWPVDGES